MTVSTSQVDIDQLLAELQVLLDQINPVRHQCADLERALMDVRRDYEKVMSVVAAETDRLEGLQRSLTTRLAGRPSAPSAQSIIEPSPPSVPSLSPVVPVSVPDIQAETPRAARKRALATHIFYFTDPNQTDVTESINTMLDDDRRDVGDMLELIPWGNDGALWKVRGDWESLEEQHERLLGWRIALEERLTFWKEEVRRLERDDFHPFFIQSQSMNASEWIAYLQDLAEKQAAENNKLASQIAELEKKWQAQQAREEVGNA
jgi:chromosome segregation ATPase